MLRIMIVDDHKIVREGLKCMFDSLKTYDIVGVADDGRAAVSMARKKKPDVIIMDVCMPYLNGIEAARQILQENPSTKIIALSAKSSKNDVDEAFMAGISGYLLKDCIFDELAAAIESVHKGNSYMSPSISNLVVRDYVSYLRNSPGTAPEAMTAREKEVLQLIAEEHSTVEIAKIMNLSPKTVESHRLNLMKKLNVNNIAGLTKAAIKLGLTPF